MRLKPDLRADLAVITTRAIDLLKAIRTLPETEGGIVAAAQAMSRQERQQTVDYLGQLAQALGGIRERALRVKRALEEG